MLSTRWVFFIFGIPFCLKFKFRFVDILQAVFPVFKRSTSITFTLAHESSWFYTNTKYMLPQLVCALRMWLIPCRRSKECFDAAARLDEEWKSRCNSIYQTFYISQKIVCVWHQCPLQTYILNVFCLLAAQRSYNNIHCHLFVLWYYPITFYACETH